MEKYKKIEKILSNWKQLNKNNTAFVKDGTIDYEKGSVLLTIYSINNHTSIYINCQTNEKDVLNAIEKIEKDKEIKL